MLFFEPLFLFVFFPLVYSVYLAVKRWLPAALTWLTAASAAFYIWAAPTFFFIALASALFDYWLGPRVKSGSGQRLALAAGCITNVGLLMIFKYSGFMVGQIANPILSIFGAAALWVPAIALPVGISFIVFEKITYLVDIYRGVSVPAPSLRNYLLFVFFFPKLLAGPIIKYHEIDNQITAGPQVSLDSVTLGFERFVVGVTKKLLIADPAGAIVDRVYSLQLADIGPADAWIGALFFTIQIYFDFAGYSDMAIGLALMLGFRLRENFNFPYISIGIVEFWRRWHISLSTWIREYLYFPLGGNRISEGRTYLNLFICFLASGLWHGARWTFIAWGAYHGFFIVAEKLFLGRWLNRIPDWLGTVATLMVLVHGWVLFRSADFAQAATMLERMYAWADPLPRRVFVPESMFIIIGLAMIGSLAPRIVSMVSLDELASNSALRFVFRVLLVLAFAVAVAGTLAKPFHPFLYFRF